MHKTKQMSSAGGNFRWVSPAEMQKTAPPAVSQFRLLPPLPAANAPTRPILSAKAAAVAIKKAKRPRSAATDKPIAVINTKFRLTPVSESGNKTKKKKQKTGAVEEEERHLPVASPVSALAQSQLRVTYSFPTTSMSAADWKFHKAALKIVPENLHLKRKGKDKSWMREKRAIRDFGCVDGRYVVPPGYGLQRFGDPAIDLRSNGIPAPRLVWQGLPLWNTPDKHCNQELLVSKVLTHFAKYKTGGVIEVPTASGKTEMAIYMACKLQVQTVFMVNSEELKTQTLARVKKVCPGATVGLIQGSDDCVKRKRKTTAQLQCSGNGHCKVEGIDFIVCMIKTLAMCECYTNDTFKTAGLVIYDEVEQVCAKQLSKAMRKTSHIRYALGMTATCDRKDGMIVMLENWLGKLIYAAPVSTPITRLVTVQVIRFYLGAKEQHYMKGTEDPDNDKTVKALVADSVRNTYIIKRILLRVSQGYRLVVVTQYVYQAYWLWQMLKRLHPHINAVWYRRGMSPELREFALNEPHHVIVSNVQLCGRGLDIPMIDGLIMTFSKPDVRQLIGRVRAFSKYRRNPLLIEDIADQFFYFVSQAGERMKQYRARDNILLNPLVVDEESHVPIVVPKEIEENPCVFVDKKELPLLGDFEAETRLPPAPILVPLPTDENGMVIATPQPREEILAFMQKCRDQDTDMISVAKARVEFDGGDLEDEQNASDDQPEVCVLPPLPPSAVFQ